MLRIRKKPVEVEAIRWTGFEKDGGCGVDALYAFGVPKDYLEPDGSWSADYALKIYNESGGCWVRCPLGHYIIRGVNGEFYPCDPEIFEKTYEIIDEVLEAIPDAPPEAASVDVEEAT